MSYIANLVHRTLGVTTVAQPVIQARFAPQSPALAAAVQDASAAQPVAPVSRVIHTLAHALLTPQALSTTEAGQRIAQPRMIDAQPEAARTREGQGIVSIPGTEPANAESPANERERVLPSIPEAEIQSAVAPDSPRVPVNAQSQQSSNWNQNAVQSGDDFRLMKAAPPAQRTQAFGASPPVYAPAVSRFGAMEPAERPVVRVHIGRVDVRIVTPGTKEPRAAVPAASEAKPTSLDEYLRARQRGSR
jgi:hypothetical protein